MYSSKTIQPQDGDKKKASILEEQPCHLNTTMFDNSLIMQLRLSSGFVEVYPSNSKTTEHTVLLHEDVLTK